jgi:hypothetical protein
MGLLLTRPNHLQFEDWADQIRMDITAKYGIAPKYSFSQEWQQWAEYLLTIPQISRFNAPDPHYFESWQDWADALIRTLE